MCAIKHERQTRQAKKRQDVKKAEGKTKRFLNLAIGVVVTS